MTPQTLFHLKFEHETGGFVYWTGAVADSEEDAKVRGRKLADELGMQRWNLVEVRIDEQDAIKSNLAALEGLEPGDSVVGEGWRYEIHGIRTVHREGVPAVLVSLSYNSCEVPLPLLRDAIKGGAVVEKAVKE